jgi:hypothetical protein
MGELVALHTQRLVEPTSGAYLDACARALRAGRMSNMFPDRRRLAGTLRALGPEVHEGLHDEIYVDARSGLPNMASFTRAITDKSVGKESLGRIAGTVEEQREDAEFFDRMARKRRYYETLQKLPLAPVDEHRVLLRRHDPERSTGMFRVELTKLAGSGVYLHVTVELTQVSGLWAHKLIDVDEAGEVASGTDALRSMVYRFATYDAETLFIRLHDLDGVEVERVQRGLIGPVLFAIPHGEGGCSRLLEPEDDALARAFLRWGDGNGWEPTQTEMIACFATDIAATNVREERSNDPLSPLLGEGIENHERGRYEALRTRHPFKVFKDRKFVVTHGLRPLVEGVCAAQGTRNPIYGLR